MQSLTDHPITRRCPPDHPDLLQLYSLLEGQDYIQSNHYTIADIAIFPGLRAVRDFYGTGEDFQMATYTDTMTYLDRCLNRPVVKRGLVIPLTD